MGIKIVIQSYKRPKNVISRELVEDPIICVPESQKNDYAEYNSCEIVTHPDSIKGLPAKKNWMYKHFGSLFMMDDDIKLIRSNIREKNVAINKQEATKQINFLYELSKEMGIYLFGFSTNQRPEFYAGFVPFLLSGQVTGGAYGITEGSKLWWNEQMKTGEDHWISCLNAYFYRKCLIDERFYLAQQSTFVGGGKLAEYRDNNTELNTFKILRQTFGETIIPKVRTKVAKNKSKFSRTILIRF